MAPHRLSLSIFVGWPSLVAIALAGRAALADAGLSGSEYAGWIFLAIAPIATWLIILRARPTGSIAQVLYDVENQDGADKRAVRVTRG